MKPLTTTGPLAGLRVAALLITICSLIVPLRANAQQTREEERTAQQAEKAKELRPYVPSKFERRVLAIERFLIGDPPPIYPYVGSIYPGGMLALGVGYRAPFSGTGLFDLHGAWSLRSYKLVDTTLRPPDLADGRIRLNLHANWIDAPAVNFYGIGNLSSVHTSNFHYRSTIAGVSGRIRAPRFLAAGAGLDYMRFTTDTVSGSRSIEKHFNVLSVPGFGAEPEYVRTSLFGQFDWRASPGYTTTGGLYRIGWADYRQRQSDQYSFQRLDVEANQHVPLLRTNWVLAFRALASVTSTDSGASVPFFLLPDLGGSSELRGYPAWRFRDRHRLLLTGEYRWMAGQFVDMALFLDAGKVAARRGDLDLSDLMTSYGLGIRIHAPTATMLRVELARTRTDGIGLILTFGPSF